MSSYSIHLANVQNGRKTKVYWNSQTQMLHAETIHDAPGIGVRVFYPQRSRWKTDLGDELLDFLTWKRTRDLS
jgi:hypothetical protein